MQSIIPAVLPMLRERHSLSFAEVGLITLTAQLTASLLQPAVGFAADRHPVRWGLAGGMVLTLAGMLLLAFESAYGQILAAVALLGCGSAVFHPQCSKLVQLASAGRKGLAQSIFQLGGNAGSAIGPLAAALVIIPMGQQSIALFSGLAAAAVALLIYVGQAGSALRSTPVNVTRKNAAIAATHPNVKLVFALLFVLMFSKQVYISSLQSYLTFFVMEKFSLSAESAQYALFAFLASGAAGTLLGGPLTDRFGERRVILASILGAAPFALLIPVCSLTIAVVLIIAVAFIMSSAFSAILVCALEAAPKHTGLVSGLFFGLTFGLGGLTAAVLGAAADVFGLTEVFRCASLLPLLGCATLWLPTTTSVKQTAASAR